MDVCEGVPEGLGQVPFNPLDLVPVWETVVGGTSGLQPSIAFGPNREMADARTNEPQRIFWETAELAQGWVDSHRNRWGEGERKIGIARIVKHASLPQPDGTYLLVDCWRYVTPEGV